MKIRVLGQVMFKTVVEVPDGTKIKTLEGTFAVQQEMEKKTIKDLMEDGFPIWNVKEIKEDLTKN